MREIKFRQWMRNRFHYMEFVNKRYFTGPESLNLDMCPLEQFTGLRDKNGREIYEGDIVTIKSNPDISVVRWHAPSCSFRAKRVNGSSYFGNYNIPEVEVIGNIHQNPELLEAN